MPSAATFAIVNQKGGVGKTTTAINLSAALAIEGLRCLVVDCDPQGNTTGGPGHSPETTNARLSTSCSLARKTPTSVLLPTELETLKLVPGNRNLIGANLELVDADRREYRLKDALEPQKANFDFILLDCPPALDLLTLNSLVAADRLLVPMQAEYFALEGISELLSTLAKVQGAFNPGLEIEGVVLTMYDERTNLAQQVTENLKGFFGDKLFKTVIPRNVRLAEAPSHGKPVMLYDARSRGSDAYRALAEELLERRKVESPRALERKRQAAQQKGKPIRFWPYS